MLLFLDCLYNKNNFTNDLLVLPNGPPLSSANVLTKIQSYSMLMFHLLSRDHISLPSTAYSRSENTRRPSVAAPVLVPPPAAFGSTAQRPHLAPVAVTASCPRTSHPPRHPTCTATRDPLSRWPALPRSPSQANHGSQKRQRTDSEDVEVENKIRRYRDAIDSTEVVKRTVSVVLQLERLKCTRARGPLTALRWSGEENGASIGASRATKRN